MPIGQRLQELLGIPVEEEKEPVKEESVPNETE